MKRKVLLYNETFYPVPTINETGGYGKEVEISETLYKRYQRMYKEWVAVSTLLGKLMDEEV